MSACDPLIQAERRFKARCLNRRRWDLFPCRGPVAPCRTLPPVSATCNGTVKPWFARPLLDQPLPDDIGTQKSPSIYESSAIDNSTFRHQGGVMDCRFR